MNDKEFFSFITQTNLFEKLGIQNILKDESLWKEVINEIFKDEEIILKGRELLEIIFRKKGAWVFQKILASFINNPFKKIKDDYINKFKEMYKET
jgi:hypothetical protein